MLLCSRKSSCFVSLSLLSQRPLWCCLFSYNARYNVFVVIFFMCLQLIARVLHAFVISTGALSVQHAPVSVLCSACWRLLPRCQFVFCLLDAFELGRLNFLMCCFAYSKRPVVPFGEGVALDSCVVCQLLLSV